MLGVRMEEAMAKRLDQMDSPLAAALSSIPKDETAVVRLNDANIYKCTHSSFIEMCIRDSICGIQFEVRMKCTASWFSISPEKCMLTWFYERQNVTFGNEKMCIRDSKLAQLD